MNQFNPAQSRKSFSQASTRLQTLVNETLLGLNKEGSELSKTQANEILAKVLGAKTYNHLSAVLPETEPSWDQDTSALLKQTDQPKSGSTKTVGQDSQEGALTLMADVTCMNQWADSAPVFMSTQISKSLVDKILQAQQYLKSTDGVSVTIDGHGAVFYNGNDDYYELEPFAALLELGEGSAEDAFEQTAKVFGPTDICRMEPATIEVTTMDFRISAVMRGAPDDFECTTPYIPLENLSARKIIVFNNPITGTEIHAVD